MTTLGELAALVGGRLQGEAQLEIGGAAAILDARPGDITLIDSASRIADLEASPAAAAVVPPGVTSSHKPTIEVADAHDAFARAVMYFRPSSPPPFRGIHASAVISPSARLDPDVTVHAGVTIGDQARIGRGTTLHSGVHVGDHVVMGAETTLYPSVVLYEHTRLGDRVTIHAGTVIGAFGFGYEQRDGRHIRAAQLGWVEIGDDVEIGASSTVDRGTYGPTIIGAGTKIDNLVQIAHNCRIGRHNLICSQVGIAGSTTTGDYVVMAGQVGVRDHVHIGHRAVLSAMAGVTSDVAEGAVMMGIPATPEREQKLKQAALAKLAEMRKEFKAVKRALAEWGCTDAARTDHPSLDAARTKGNAA